VILSVCLNPALQRTLVFRDLALRRVNRAASVLVSVGGKGANVAAVLQTLGAENRLLLPLGGRRGREVADRLGAAGTVFRAVPVRAETRICTTLLDAVPSTVTELVEESGPFSGKEVRALQAAFERLLPSARLVILSGTAPRGFPADIYGRWIRMAGRAGVPSLLDAAEPFAGPGLSAGPWFYRVNWREMEAVLGRSVPVREAFSAMEELRGLGARNVLISLDGPAAIADIGGRFARISAPALKAVNSIGSGDAMAAGMGDAYIKGKDAPEILRRGMACGAANVLTPTAGTVRPSEVRSLAPRIRIVFPA
jgi:1-phosphofructokinase family hexose kinase